MKFEKNIKAVVFDLNGVFLKSEYLTTRVQERYGIPSDEVMVVLKESLKNTRLNPELNIFDFWKPLFDKYNIDTSEQSFLSFWFEGETLVTELVDLVRSIKKSGIKVYIFSNNFRERTQYYRENFKEIFENVDDSFFSWETGLVKSDIKAYENLLSRTNLEASDVLYFDDSQENIGIARSISIDGYIYEGVQSTINKLEEKGIFKTI